MAQVLKGVLLAGLAAAALSAAAMHDPMAPPAGPAPGVAAQPAAPPFSPAPLLWTRVGGQGPVAWYGGRPVGIGEMVEGGRIVAIAEDHIVIAAQGRLHRVSLIPADWRQPVNDAAKGQEHRTGGKHVKGAPSHKPAAHRAAHAPR